MEFKDLKYIFEIARVGSITQASKTLYVSQPNLSKKVKELESKIGITLFTRSSKGVQLTNEGREFLDYSKSLIQKFESLENFYNKNKQNRLTLSISTSRSSKMCASMISFLNKENFSDLMLNINFNEGTNFDVINDVLSNHFDFGIIRHSTSNSNYFFNLGKSKFLTYIPFCINKYIILMNINHPLAGSNIVTYHDLKDYIEVAYVDFDESMFLFYNDEKSDLLPAKKLLKLMIEGAYWILYLM